MINSEAERSVIGSIINNNDVLDNIIDIVNVNDFAAAQHRTLFKAMLDLSESGTPIDEITLIEQLKRNDKQFDIAYIAQLSSAVPTTAHAVAYARIVRDKAIQRRLVAAAGEILQQGKQDGIDIKAYSDKAESLIYNATENNRNRNVPIKNTLLEIRDDIDKAYDSIDPLCGLSTGFDDLDYKTSGFQDGDLIVVAARPSMGKTALALNIAYNMTRRDAISVAVFSLEMSQKQLTYRLLSIESRVDLVYLRTGKLNRNEMDKLPQRMEPLSKLPVHIDDSGALTITQMRSKCRRLQREHGIKIAFLDYLQLMSSSNRENRTQEISEISRGLKSIARELNMPIVALSQLNRSLESRTDKRPMLSDLRESGAIEQDADVVIFLYRDEYYHKDQMPEDLEGVAEVIIAKQRNGPTGKFKLYFDKKCARFDNLTTAI